MRLQSRASSFPSLTIVPEAIVVSSLVLTVPVILAATLAAEAGFVPRGWFLAAPLVGPVGYLLIRHPTVLVALYLSAYTFKRAPILGEFPDLTVAFGILCVGLVAWRVLRGDRVPMSAALLMAAVTLVIASSLLRDLTPYGQEKVFRFVTLTTLAMVAMVMLVDNVRQFCITLLLVGVALSIASIVSGETSSSGRTEVFGDYLMVARQQAMAFVAGILVGGRWQLVGILGLVGVGISSARGPFLAALLAPILRMSVRVALGVMAGTMVLFTPLANPLMSRIDDLSDTSRSAALASSWEAFREAPLLGWGSGGFAEWAPYIPIHPLYYPHNLFAEVGVEWGAVGLAVVVAFLGQALSIALHTRDAMAILFLFALLGAMVTGDINANRQLWAFAAFLVAYPSGSPIEDARAVE